MQLLMRDWWAHLRLIAWTCDAVDFFTVSVLSLMSCERTYGNDDGTGFIVSTRSLEGIRQDNDGYCGFLFFSLVASRLLDHL